jgi:hypothetical protein
MRTAGVAIVAILAACSDERGLPPGFLERAARSSPAEPGIAAGNGSEPAAPGAPTDGAPALDPPTGDRPDDGNAPLLTGDAASDRASIAEADQATERLVAAVASDLSLGPAPVTQTPTGSEPFKQRAQEPRFDAFRSACGRYHQLRRALLPFGERLASGTATPAERRDHDRLEQAAKAEQQRLSRMLWRPGITSDDRAAMSWIMFGPTAATPIAAP